MTFSKSLFSPMPHSTSNLNLRHVLFSRENNDLPVDLMLWKKSGSIVGESSCQFSPLFSCRFLLIITNHSPFGKDTRPRRVMSENVPTGNSLPQAQRKMSCLVWHFPFSWRRLTSFSVPYPSLILLACF